MNPQLVVGILSAGLRQDDRLRARFRVVLAGVALADPQNTTDNMCQRLLGDLARKVRLLGARVARGDLRGGHEERAPVSGSQRLFREQEMRCDIAANTGSHSVIQPFEGEQDRPDACNLLMRCPDGGLTTAQGLPSLRGRGDARPPFAGRTAPGRGPCSAECSEVLFWRRRIAAFPKCRIRLCAC